MAIGHSHHRNATASVGQEISGNVTVTTTPTEMKVGSEILEGRTSLFVINDSSKLVEISTNPNLVIGGGNITAFSGEAISFEFEPNPGPGEEPTRVFAIIEEGSTPIRVVEVK